MNGNRKISKRRFLKIAAASARGAGLLYGRYAAWVIPASEALGSEQGDTKMSKTISQDEALKLCGAILRENHGKVYTFNGLWCWGCSTFSGEPKNRCFGSAPGCRGCAQVNRRYDRQVDRG